MIDPSDVQAHVDPTDVQVESASVPTAQPGILAKAGGVASDLLQGAGAGVFDTIHGTGEVIRKGLNAVHAGAGDAVVPPSGQAAMAPLQAANNTTQKVGKTAEDIGEFVVGDEALKGLTLGKRALEAAGLAEKYEKASPFVKAAIEHTMNAIRQGGVTAAETGNKTGSATQAAEAGAGAAAGSAALGVAGDLAGKGLQYIRAAKDFKALPGALDQALTDTVSKKAVADGLQATTGNTAAEHLADSALQYQTRAKQGYQIVDNAVNGELQPVQDKLTQIKKAIKMSIDPEVTDKLRAQQEHYQDLFKDAIERAKANGVPDAEQIIQKADKDYNTFRAQSDLSTRLQKAAGPNGPASPAGLHVWSKQLGTPKIVGGTSRLAQALGPDGAEAVQKIAAEGRSKATELAAQASKGDAVKLAAAKGAAGAVGLGGAGYLGYKLAH